MMKTRNIHKIFSLLLAMSVLLGCFAFSFAVQAAGAGQRVISIDNKGGDDNPFIRFFPNKEKCGTGGPFTFSVDVKIEGYARLPGHTNDNSVFINLMHQDTEHKMTSLKSWKSNIDWTTFSYQFNNISATLIDGSMREYALIDIGVIYAKAKVSIRNFKITNKAGNVVYSIDTDPDLEGISDLRDIGSNNPEPFLLNCAFENSGTAKYPITVSSSGGKTTTTAGGPVYEDETTTSKTTTTTSPKNTDNTTQDSDSTDITEDTTGETGESTDISGNETEPTGSMTSMTESDSDETDTPKYVKKINWPAVIALIVGVIVLLAGAGAAFIVLRKKKMQANSEKPDEFSDSK